MVAGIRPGPGGPTDREVMKGMGVMPLRLRFKVIRLTYLSRLLRRGPPQLFSALSVSAAARWWSEVVQDLVSMKEVLGKKLEQLPSPTVDLQPWLDVAREFPVSWKHLANSFAQQLSRDEAEHEAEEPEAPHFDCEFCPAAFSSFHGLRTHLARAHGICRWYRGFVDASGSCPACSKHFWNRTRVLAHLRRSARCQSYLAAHPELELDHLTVFEAEAAEREQKRARSHEGLCADVALRPCLPAPP